VIALMTMDAHEVNLLCKGVKGYQEREVSLLIRS
jgi:hypothetical protein